MKKDTLAITAILLLFLGGAYLYTKDQTNVLGGVGSDPSYSGVTSGSTVCSGATSTLISATSTGRTSFIVSLGVSTTPGGQAIYLCRSNMCLVNTGIPLVTSTPTYEQKDSYVGPYSCIAVTTSSTVVTSQSK